MTLAVGFVIVGLLQVYQRTTLGAGTEFPEAIVWLGVGLSWGIPTRSWFSCPWRCSSGWA